ncbi:Muscle, Skeletal Receptor Tyrosine-Protein Kinase, partial [Manis pentadactyla]
MVQKVDGLIRICGSECALYALCDCFSKLTCAGGLCVTVHVVCLCDMCVRAVMIVPFVLCCVNRGYCLTWRYLVCDALMVNGSGYFLLVGVVWSGVASLSLRCVFAVVVWSVSLFLCVCLFMGCVVGEVFLCCVCVICVRLL